MRWIWDATDFLGAALMWVGLIDLALITLLIMVRHVVKSILQAIPSPAPTPAQPADSAGDAIPPDTRCRVVGGLNAGDEVTVCWLASPWWDSYFVERDDGRYDYESGCDLEILVAA